MAVGDVLSRMRMNANNTIYSDPIPMSKMIYSSLEELQQNIGKYFEILWWTPNLVDARRHDSLFALNRAE